MSTPGTPKTLEDAIIQALCIGPMSGTKERVYLAVKDFLAQKFQKLYIAADGDEKLLSLLKTLFNDITKRQEKSDGKG